ALSKPPRGVSIRASRVDAQAIPENGGIDEHVRSLDRKEGHEGDGPPLGTRGGIQGAAQAVAKRDAAQPGRPVRRRHRLVRRAGIHTAWIRAAFVFGALLAGAGIPVYLACWLIIPQEGEQPGEASSSWLVGLARACAVCLGLAALAALAAAATLLGFGWLAVALATAVLAVVLVAW